MTQEEKFNFCQTLVEGFLTSISDSKIKHLHQQWLYDIQSTSSNISTRRANMTYKYFKEHQLRILVINLLLQSEHASMFINLDDIYIAKLLRISPHKFNAVIKNILRKIRLLNIKDDRINLQELKLQLETLYYIDDTDSTNND